MKISAPIIEKLMPEYWERHLFAAKLRLVTFFAFWAIYLYFLWDVLGQTKVLAAIIIAASILTSIAYYNIVHNKRLLGSFFVEIVCDLVSITTVVYLTDGPYSSYFTIYFFYALIAGILYTYQLAAVISVFAAIFYGGFLVLCHTGIIPPLILDYGDKLPVPAYTPFAHFFFVLISLAGVVYTVKVASHFSQQRERMLEGRNRELTALNKMSSTFRSATELRGVIENILAGVLEGLSFETAIFMLFDKVKGKIIFHVPARTERLKQIEKIIGRPLDGMEIPIKAITEGAMQDIMKQRIIFRRNVSELTAGIEEFISQEHGAEIQKLLGVKRIVIMPVVVGQETLGVLLGFSRKMYVEDKDVSTMEAFANQSALLLEAAMLIDRLTRVNEQLNIANLVKSEFLATMSHELRTPLTAIIGFSELLMEGIMGELTDEQKESLREVLHNAADLLELINSLLDLTKIESGKMKLDRRTFDIRETGRRVCSTITPLVHKKNQQLVVSVAEKLPIVFGDERKIQQTLLNLIANANKFTPEGGRIEFSMGTRESGEIEITVSDNGIGIKKDQLEEVFEMFHQADNSMTRNFGGTGVGLALAKKFIEMHHGRIWVESEIDQGTKFTVLLPVKS